MSEPMEPGDLAPLADLPDDDPRVRALGARERARLRAMRAFLDPGDAPAGARIDEAERRLGETLERELGVTIGGRSEAPAARATGGARRAGSFLEALIGPRFRPAFAVALVVVVAGGAWLIATSRRGDETPAPSGGPPAQEPLLRGNMPAAPGVDLTTTVQPIEGGTRLAWTPSADASSYTLSFFSADLVEVSRINDVRETHFDLVAGTPPFGLTAGSKMLWRVTAMRGADAVARSATSTITVP